MKLVLEMTDEERSTESAATADRLAHLMNLQLQIFLCKNRTYGDAWRRQGWRGNLARILSKTDRLRHMLWTSIQFENMEEPIEDNLQDLALLCMFMMINRMQENEWGNGH